MKTTLLIVYEPGNGKACALARVRDRGSVLRAARQAMREKRQEVSGIASIDAGLGSIARGELEAMQRTLGQMVPGLVSAPRHYRLKTATGGR